MRFEDFLLLLDKDKTNIENFQSDAIHVFEGDFESSIWTEFPRSGGLKLKGIGGGSWALSLAANPYSYT